LKRAGGGNADVGKSLRLSLHILEIDTADFHIPSAPTATDILTPSRQKGASPASLTFTRFRLIFRLEKSTPFCGNWNWKRGVPQIAVGICNFSFTQHQRMIGVD
jgi:hypothetical protein